MEKGFLKKLGVSEEELLKQVRDERTEGEDFSRTFKEEIEIDLKLLNNKRDKRKDEKLVGDSTIFNTHSALMARSYQSKNQIRLKGDKNGAEREVKMLNEVLTEDNESAAMKALRYYIYYDKFATGVSIVCRAGWDGVYKRNIFGVINPLNWIMSPNGDYFTGNYPYTGFFAIKNKNDIEAMGLKPEDIALQTFSEGAIEQKERMQHMLGLYPDFGKEVFDLYYHFTIVNGRKVYVVTVNLDNKIVDAGFVPPSSPLEEKETDAISFPFAFYYWKPSRDNPFGDRPANYIRDIQIVRARNLNLALNKAEAELYPMYIYNKDYVSNKDLAFGFNKGIPVSTGIDGASVNLQNIVSPIQRDLRIDTFQNIDAVLSRNIEKSTSIGEVVQGTTPSRKETLGTNNLIESNTDTNLSLNEEIHAIGDDQFVKIWFGGYYENFADGDKKLVFAGSSTAKTAITLKRKDFVFEGNLNISVESNIASEDRKKRENAAITQIAPMILPSIGPAAKIKLLRFQADRAGIPTENVEEFLIDTPQMAKQSMENELLKINLFVKVSAEDDDEQHLIEMGSNINTKAAEIHRDTHIQAMIAKGTQPAAAQTGINENAMANSAASQAMSQAGSVLTQ